MFTADNIIVGLQEEIEKALGIQYLRIGWTETDTDTIYCEVVAERVLRVHVWNQTGIRAELAIALGKPVWRP